MSFFPDLSYYSHPHRLDASVALNVGWLSRMYPYTQGNVPQEFLNRLWIYCRTLVNPMRGYYRCELCEDNVEWPVAVFFDGKRIFLGSAEIRVLSLNGKIYASPNMIFHYVLEHRYHPPEEFVNAVLTGYLPSSPEFHALQLKYDWRISTA